jgi:hypothetical protein
MSAAAERFALLGEGEILKGDPLVKGLSPKPVLCIVRKISKQGAATLDLEFMGVKLGRAGGKVTPAGTITWYEEK